MRALKTLLPFLLLIAVVGTVLGGSPFFVVTEREHAIKFRFGEILRSDYEPGIHFKAPFVHNVNKFDNRVLTLDNRPEEFLTEEKKNVIVDFFVKWQITDVENYYRATGGNELNATERLVKIVYDGLRNEFAKRTVKEVVSAERTEIVDVMLQKAQAAATEFGINIVDVRVKRIDLPDEVSTSVFQRMTQERARTAAQLRAEGAEAAERIRSAADRERTVILAEAFRDAERIRGEGDARAAEIYALAYEEDEEFYSFYRSLESYRKSIGNGQDVLVLDPDSEFFRYFGNKK
ncbi:MAG: protease modulator HflC [Gammaproteobacteria bacterium]|nr:protease modulator HflC [Gammaproteobacteria bacterium]